MKVHKIFSKMTHFLNYTLVFFYIFAKQLLQNHPIQFELAIPLQS